MSSNDVIPFQFEQQTIRVVNLNGEPWFVTADVCAVLGLLPHRGGHSHHLTKLKADERRITPRSDIGVSGKGGAISLISEPGLYKLILRSDKPNARTFQDWVTREVLPTIRKTGEYRVPRKGLSRLCLDDAREARLSWELATTIAAGVGLKGNQLLIAANRYTRRVLGIDMLETMGVPLLPAPEPEVLMTATGGPRLDHDEKSTLDNVEGRAGYGALRTTRKGVRMISAPPVDRRSMPSTSRSRNRCCR